MPIRLLLSVAFVCFLAVPAVAAPAGNITASLQQKYDNITSMEAKFSQTIIHKESGAKETRTGTLYFKKPLLVRWEAEKPTKELLVVGENAIWNVFPDEEVAYKYPVSMVHDTHNIFRVITGGSRLEQDFTVENKGMENGLVRLNLFPHEPVQSLVEAVFWVDPNTMLIQKFRITDFYGNHNDITFTSYKLDGKVAASQFAYTPEKGFMVEDRTQNNGAPRKNFLQ